MDEQKAIRDGKVDVGGGVRKTLHQLIKAGLMRIERPPSKHRGFTHTGKTKEWRKQRKQKRLVAQASKRRNRSAKRHTGVTPVRSKRVKWA